MHLFICEVCKILLELGNCRRVQRHKGAMYIHSCNIDLFIFNCSSVKQDPSWATLDVPSRRCCIHTYILDMFICTCSSVKYAISCSNQSINQRSSQSHTWAKEKPHPSITSWATEDVPSSMEVLIHKYSCRGCCSLSVCICVTC